MPISFKVRQSRLRSGDELRLAAGLAQTLSVGSIPTAEDVPGPSIVNARARFLGGYAGAPYAGAPYAGGAPGSSSSTAQTISVGSISTLEDVPGPTLLFNQAIIVASIGSGEVVPGPFLSETGITPSAPYAPRITAGIYDRTGALVVALPDSFGRQWQDQANQTGSGQAKIQSDDSAAGLIPYRSILRFSLDSNARFAVLVEEKVTTAIAQGEDVDETIVLKGRGTLAIFEEALVYPELPPGQLPFSDTRLFSYASTKYDDSGWHASYIVKNQGNSSNPYAGAPKNWPDDTANWIWAAPSATPQPVGDSYFRKTFSLGVEGTVRVFASADDGFDIYIDGAPLMSDTMAYLWGDTKQADVFLSAGTHTIACKGTNIARPSSPSTNIAALLISVMTVNSDGTLGSVIVNTDATWKSVAYPAVVPGFTPGQILRILKEEAQARGTLSAVSLGFTDGSDSNGNPWPVIGSVAFQVGLDMLSALKQLTDTYIDVSIDVATPVLRAYVTGTRGVTSSVMFTPSTLSVPGNLMSLVHDGVV